jgi:hypothetical protein
MPLTIRWGLGIGKRSEFSTQSQSGIPGNLRRRKPHTFPHAEPPQFSCVQQPKSFASCDLQQLSDCFQTGRPSRRRSAPRLRGTVRP